MERTLMKAMATGPSGRVLLRSGLGVALGSGVAGFSVLVMPT
jgi:hypothetical protein